MKWEEFPKHSVWVFSPSHLPGLWKIWDISDCAQPSSGLPGAVIAKVVSYLWVSKHKARCPGGAQVFSKEILYPAVFSPVEMGVGHTLSVHHWNCTISIWMSQQILAKTNAMSYFYFLSLSLPLLVFSFGLFALMLLCYRVFHILLNVSEKPKTAGDCWFWSSGRGAARSALSFCFKLLVTNQEKPVRGTAPTRQSLPSCPEILSSSACKFECSRHCADHTAPKRILHFRFEQQTKNLWGFLVLFLFSSISLSLFLYHSTSPWVGSALFGCHFPVLIHLSLCPSCTGEGPLSPRCDTSGVVASLNSPGSVGNVHSL